MGNKAKHYAGSCLCGAVQYEIDGPLTDLHACHCSQCRRQSGHFVAATSARRSEFKLIRSGSLTWFRSSQTAKRGFCGDCGSVLFWDDGSDDISINAGSLNQPTGLTLASHIFVDDKADYYEIADDLPKFAGFDQPIDPT